MTRAVHQAARPGFPRELAIANTNVPRHRDPVRHQAVFSSPEWRITWKDERGLANIRHTSASMPAIEWGGKTRWCYRYYGRRRGANRFSSRGRNRNLPSEHGSAELAGPDGRRTDRSRLASLRGSVLESGPIRSRRSKEDHNRRARPGRRFTVLSSGAAWCRVSHPLPDCIRLATS